MVAGAGECLWANKSNCVLGNCHLWQLQMPIQASISGEGDGGREAVGQAVALLVGVSHTHYASLADI